MKIKIIVVFWLTLLHFSLSLKYSRPFPSRSTSINKPAQFPTWSSRPFSRSPGRGSSSTFINTNYHCQRFVPNSRTQSSLRGPIPYPIPPGYGYLPTHSLINPPPPSPPRYGNFEVPHGSRNGFHDITAVNVTHEIHHMLHEFQPCLWQCSHLDQSATSGGGPCSPFCKC